MVITPLMHTSPVRSVRLSQSAVQDTDMLLLWSLFIVALPAKSLPRHETAATLGAHVASPQSHRCNQKDVIDYLNLTRKNDMYTTSRPVKDWRNSTVVKLTVILYSITTVVEKLQVFTPFLWVTMSWNNEFISWNPDRFCNMTELSVPRKLLWIPNITVKQLIEIENNEVSPYLKISHDGTIYMEDEIKGVMTCKMDMYKFPFDTQHCNVSFSSYTLAKDEMMIDAASNSSQVTKVSREVMQVLGDWEFINMAVQHTESVDLNDTWEDVTFVISMRRRPLLHVINFLVPILFFLTLDIASFFISDTRGEKLGFKVTVLLAISVLLLILNDILPSTSDKTPLIATYCIVIFTFMLLSLLETIIVTYMIEKGSSPKTTERRDDTACTSRNMEEVKSDHRDVVNTRADDASAPDGATKADCSLQMILQELHDMRDTLPSCALEQEGNKSQYWVTLAKRVDAAFLCFYIVGITLFLVFLFIRWTT